jgi:hypothetical protein
MKMLKTNMAATHVDTDLFELPIYTGSSFQYRIPTTLPKMLDLSNNKFTGTTPKEIGHLKSLTKLNLSFNCLSGETPQQLCSLTNLEVLDLSNNYLTGEIPLALNKLNFLSIFNISNNDLEGPIPTGGQFDTFKNPSFAGKPKLCGAIIDRPCHSAEAPPVSVLSTEQRDRMVAFAVAFGAFFGVGVLYDQIVMYRYFG